MLSKNVLYFDELVSTNTKMKELAMSGAESGLALRAGFQSGGRGRLGRSWESACGEGLYMSILLRNEGALAQPAELMPLISGLGVRNAIESFIHSKTGKPRMDSPAIRIKWPNDVLSGRRKVSGILVETSARGNDIDYFIIGIGVNVNTRGFPDELKDRATSFFLDTNKTLDIDEVAIKIVYELDSLYTRFFTGDMDWLDEYVSQCAGIGETVRIINGEHEILGKAVGVNVKGELMVETYAGERIAVRSGEVSVRGLNGYI